VAFTIVHSFDTSGAPVLAVYLKTIKLFDTSASSECDSLNAALSRDRSQVFGTSTLELVSNMVCLASSIGMWRFALSEENIAWLATDRLRSFVSEFKTTEDAKCESYDLTGMCPDNLKFQGITFDDAKTVTISSSQSDGHSSGCLVIPKDASLELERAISDNELRSYIFTVELAITEAPESKAELLRVNSARGVISVLPDGTLEAFGRVTSAKIEFNRLHRLTVLCSNQGCGYLGLNREVVLYFQTRDPSVARCDKKLTMARGAISCGIKSIKVDKDAGDLATIVQPSDGGLQTEIHALVQCGYSDAWATKAVAATEKNKAQAVEWIQANRARLAEEDIKAAKEAALCAGKGALMDIGYPEDWCENAYNNLSIEENKAGPSHFLAALQQSLDTILDRQTGEPVSLKPPCVLLVPFLMSKRIAILQVSTCLSRKARV